MEKQVSATSKSCFYQIRNIGRIRTYITDDACKTLVNSLVTSRLDYGNAMLYGLPANITNKLQRVQNTAARLISKTKKHQHTTLILVSLHWLHVHYRCQYKLLMYVFKSLHGSAPVYLQELASVYQLTRSLRSENCALIKPSRIYEPRLMLMARDVLTKQLLHSLFLFLLELNFYPLLVYDTEILLLVDNFFFMCMIYFLINLLVFF